MTEQLSRGKRKKLKTEASHARVPLSATMASALADVRPENVNLKAPVFPSKTGTVLNYSNVYHRTLRPALRECGLDDQGIGFHAFRKACGSLLLANGKTVKQVQGWLRHSRLTTTLNVYINQVDDGLGDANLWDEVLADDPSGPPRGHQATGELQRARVRQRPISREKRTNRSLPQTPQIPMVHRLSTNALEAVAGGLPVGVNVPFAMSLRLLALVSRRFPLAVSLTLILAVSDAEKILRPDATSIGLALVVWPVVRHGLPDTSR